MDSKTNEAKTVFVLLKSLVLKGQVIVGDAISCNPLVFKNEGIRSQKIVNIAAVLRENSWNPQRLFAKFSQPIF